MLYFAYGSNMEVCEITEPCPSADFRCTATLRDHRIAFTRMSRRRGCGVADVLPEKGHDVWGVVYDIPEPELPALDAKEGYKLGRAKNAYVRRDVTVYEAGNQLKPMVVCTYFAEREASPPLPNECYKKTILRGARHWNLPDHYIAELDQIRTAWGINGDR